MSSENTRLEQQILSKIEEMEQPGYEWPERFPRRHMIIVVCSVVLCAVLLILGSRIV